MKRPGRKVLAAVAAVLVVVAAGCGGGGSERLSKSEYEQKLKSEGSQLKTAFQAVDIENSANLKDLSGKLTKLQRQLSRSADDIAAVKPPKDAEDANAKLADVLHKFADKFGEMKKAAQANNFKRVQEINGEIATISKQGQQAATELKNKGYDIGTLGEG
jgi:hypothetical protein